MPEIREPIEVRSYGSDGPRVIVLHGGPGAPGSASGLARALSPTFRAHEPLQRWSGSTPLTVASHVADLAQVVGERSLLVGHSWGAMLALSFAVRHSQLVQAIALVGCGTYDVSSRELYRERMQRCLEARGALVKLEGLRARIAVAPDEATRDNLRAEVARLAGNATTIEPGEPNEIERVDARGNRETWEDALRLQREDIEPAAFAGIHVPVIMFHGDEDPHPGPETRDTLRRVIPQLEYVSFAQCGHEPWRERHARDAFLRALHAWLHRHAV